MPNFCAYCGAPMNGDAAFCPACGKPAAAPETPAAPTEKTAAQLIKDEAMTAAKGAAARAANVAAGLLTDQLASAVPGETLLGSFGGASSALPGALEILNPFATLLSGVKSAATGVVSLFKNKQWWKIVVAGVIAALWIALMILARHGVRIPVLDWLTFAQGGMGRSVFGMLGGTLGKLSVATMLFSLLSGGFKSIGGGAKSLFAGANFKPANLGMLLLGAGGALLLYQFFAGNAALTDTMAAISGIYFSLAALGGGGGFLYRLTQSLTAKKTGNTRAARPQAASALLTGATFGFTAGGFLSVIPFFGWIPMILGGHCIIAGIVLALVFKNRKEAAA